MTVTREVQCVKPYIHQVQYYETDAMGAVHHSNYIRWFEEARVDYMAQLGVSYRELEQRGLFSPVLEMHCSYRSMTRFGERVSIAISVLEMTNVRFRLAYVVTDCDSGSVRAEGESVHCFVNREGKVVSLRREDAGLFALFSAQIAAVPPDTKKRQTP